MATTTTKYLTQEGAQSIIDETKRRIKIVQDQVDEITGIEFDGPYENYDDMVSSVEDPRKGTIYLVKNDGEDPNVCDEYFYKESGIETAHIADSESISGNSVVLDNDDFPYEERTRVGVELVAKGSLEIRDFSYLSVGLMTSSNPSTSVDYGFWLNLKAIKEATGEDLEAGDKILYYSPEEIIFVKKSDNKEYDISSGYEAYHGGADSSVFYFDPDENGYEISTGVYGKKFLVNLPNDGGMAWGISFYTKTEASYELFGTTGMVIDNITEDELDEMWKDKGELEMTSTPAFVAPVSDDADYAVALNSIASHTATIKIEASGAVTITTDDEDGVFNANLSGDTLTITGTDIEGIGYVTVESASTAVYRAISKVIEVSYTA